MKLKAFSIRDAKTEAWMPPMFMRSRGEALRSFSDEVNAPKRESSMISMHPEDFTLFEIGEFDTDTGALVNGQQPYSLGVGSNFLRGDSMQ